MKTEDRIVRGLENTKVYESLLFQPINEIIRKTMPIPHKDPPPKPEPKIKKIRREDRIFKDGVTTYYCCKCKQPKHYSRFWIRSDKEGVKRLSDNCNECRIGNRDRHERLFRDQLSVYCFRCKRVLSYRSFDIFVDNNGDRRVKNNCQDCESRADNK